MKPTIFKISTFVLLFAFMAAGCEDNADSVAKQLDQLDFKIVTLDKNKAETRLFSGGEDIVLVFKAINNSGKTMDLKLKSDYLTCKVFQRETDFFLIKKKAANYDSNLSDVSIGKPYLKPVNCLTVNLPYYVQTFTDNETIIESANWSSNPDNKNLEPGKYFTSFSLSLDDENFSKTWNLRWDFEVK